MLPSRRQFGTALAASLWQPRERPPNFVIFLCDDLGYGDLGCYGNRTIRTPNIDRMATEGVRLTEFYTLPTCTPSRAALLTGRYPMRSGLTRVLIPREHFGIPENEITLAEALKQRRYQTACIGKWHLGDAPRYRPNRHGFDYFYGILYSHDMMLPVVHWPPVKLFRDGTPIESPARQRTLTSRFTAEAIEFLDNNKDRPFFLYLAYTMPHVPWLSSAEFSGKSRHGAYGDAVEEIDWSVGRVLDRLARLGLDENTFVIFTSDNGPELATPEPGGSTGGLRGGKRTAWEGGVRVPCILRWPGVIPGGDLLRGITCLMDLYTTITEAAGVQLPAAHVIDGTNVLPLLRGEAPSPRSVFCCYRNGKLHAMRFERWKIHFIKSEIGRKGGVKDPVACSPPELYDLEEDPAELRNLSSDHPDVIERLTRVAAELHSSIATGRPAPYMLRSLLPGRRKR